MSVVENLAPSKNQQAAAGAAAKSDKTDPRPFIHPEDALASPELQELARLAIEEFRPRGRGYDENCSMPKENIHALFERGWLSTTVPKAVPDMRASEIRTMSLTPCCASFLGIGR